jgi:hypothetical protein
VLLTAGGLALCGGAVALSPIAINKAGQYTAEKIDEALAAGAANARLALLHELENLEGVSIDVALGVANLTKLAVKFIVGPAAAVMAVLGTAALNLLVSSLETVIAGLGYIPGAGGAQAPLQHLHDMLVAWRLNVTSLPKQLSDYLNWDIDSAEKYLIALQNKINAEKDATPVPTPNTGLPLGN